MFQFKLKYQKDSPADLVRQSCRRNEFSRDTSKSAPGYVQANLTILPKEFAFDFLLFCLRNPKSCPLLEVCEPGNLYPKSVALNANLATDLPKYCILKNGEVTETVHNIEKYWRDDLVSFLLGCSFSWDSELENCGLTPRHVAEGLEIPMYQSNIPLQSAGIFKGDMVVSMRPYKQEFVDTVSKISASFPAAHGGPIHIGDPASIGIKVDKDGKIGPSDFGGFVALKLNDVPMFWACGVTPLSVLKNAKLPFAITHFPGHMFVTDILSEDIKVSTA